MRKNAVAHFEIYAKDPVKLSHFYTGLFDWTIDAVPGMDYRFVKSVDTDDQGSPTQAGGINGGIITRPAGFNDRAWVNYVNVDSLDASIDKAKSLRASVMKPRSAVPGMGWFAILSDPEGNTFALWEQDAAAK